MSYELVYFKGAARPPMDAAGDALAQDGTAYDAPMRKVRISSRVIGHLEGSDAWQSGWAAVECGYERGSTVQMTEAIKAGKRRKDGSVSVWLSEEQCDALYRMADCMKLGAQDNLGWMPEALGDFNAARSLMKNLKRV